jgi:tetratricopeptide (TPR) repeat protein
MREPYRFLLALLATLALAPAASAQTEESTPQPAVDSALRIEELIDRTTADPADANAWTQLGILYTEEGLLGDARAAFISALQAAPAEPMSHMNLAICLVRMESWGEAAAPLASYRQMVPEDVRGWSLGGQAAAEQGDTDGAVAVWLEGAHLPEMPAGDKALLVTQATGHLLHTETEDSEPTEAELRRAGEILDAEKTLLEGADAAELRTRRDYAWLELARRREEAGDTSAALQCWAHLRETGSASQAAWIQPVQIHLDNGEIAEAKQIATEATNVLTGSAIVEFLNGRVADAENDPRAAAQAYRKAADIDPDLPGVWPALGEALAKSGDSKGATDALAEAVKRGQGGSAAAYNMGVVLNQKNQFAEAIPYLEDAIEADPTNRDAFRALGTAYRKEKRFADAARTYQAVIDNLGPDAKDLYQLAYCQAKEGEHTKAAANYEMVTVMEPGNVNAFYGLGNAHSKVGNQDRAIAAYQAALELKPDFHGASFGWALALQKEGDYEAAIERYELTLELEETYSSYVNMAICYKALGDEETSDEYYALADELKKKGR